MSKSQLIGEIVSKDGDIERLKSRVARLTDLAYAPDGREHRSLMFGAVAENQALKDGLLQCQTLTPSLLTGDDAIARLKEINQFVYRVLRVQPPVGQSTLTAKESK